MNKTNAVIARQRSLTVSEVKVLVESGFNPGCCREKNRYQEEKSMNIKHASQATRVLKTNTSSGFLFIFLPRIQVVKAESTEAVPPTHGAQTPSGTAGHYCGIENLFV